VLLAVAAGGTYAESSSASTCVNLKVTKKIKKALKAAHKRLTSRHFTGPKKGSIYYGRCGRTHYALASFKDKDLSYTDQPERFRRRAHHRWADKGDTGGDACGGPTPVKLLHLWGFSSCS
jgi:hypothetical protein